ncbi:hypothetical protein TREES_T100017649 [Tupaia chinensis]|uniref:Uncharacterized protein n=1 Tax=Tupaia chinensis TaxID=246437 RepID=L9L3M8_TUPCH|nr:hypothetical protein TREES_T100017649 [Tupaia chinensis]
MAVRSLLCVAPSRAEGRALAAALPAGLSGPVKPAVALRACAFVPARPGLFAVARCFPQAAAAEDRMGGVSNDAQLVVQCFLRLFEGVSTNSPGVGINCSERGPGLPPASFSSSRQAEEEFFSATLAAVGMYSVCIWLLGSIARWALRQQECRRSDPRSVGSDPVTQRGQARPGRQVLDLTTRSLKFRESQAQGCVLPHDRSDRPNASIIACQRGVHGATAPEGNPSSKNRDLLALSCTVRGVCLSATGTCCTAAQASLHTAPSLRALAVLAHRCPKFPLRGAQRPVPGPQVVFG